MELPNAQQEVELLRLGLDRPLIRWDRDLLPAAVLSEPEVVSLRLASRRSYVRDELLVYLQAVAQSVREEPVIDLGPSSEGGLGSARGGARRLLARGPGLRHPRTT